MYPIILFALFGDESDEVTVFNYLASEYSINQKNFLLAKKKREEEGDAEAGRVCVLFVVMRERR